MPIYRHVLEVDLPWLENVTRARRPKRLPVVLTPVEVRSVLSGIALQLICSKQATISAQCKNCWGTPMCGPRCFTPMSWEKARWASKARWIAFCKSIPRFSAPRRRYRSRGYFEIRPLPLYCRPILVFSH
jgi:hypothetical protein